MVLVQARTSIVTPIGRNNASNLLSNTVNGIFGGKVSEDGVLWLATDVGVSYQTPGTSEFTHINSSTHPSILDNVATSVMVSEKLAWVWNSPKIIEEGFTRYDRASGAVDRVAFDPGSTRALHSNAITSLAMTPNGSVSRAGTYGDPGTSIVDEGWEMSYFKDDKASRGQRH